LFKEIVRQRDHEHLELLGQSGLLDSFYIAGGVGVALYLGHRSTADFDFFSSEPFDNAVLREQLNSLGNFQEIGSVWGVLHGVFNGMKTSFVSYQHPLIFPTNKYKGVAVADLIDVALMKLDCLSNRGFKRDFIDVYCIDREGLHLRQLLEYFPKKYPQGNLYQVIKSLGYFTDADKQPSPKMAIPTDWDAVKQFFVQSQRELMKEYWP